MDETLARKLVDEMAIIVTSLNRLSELTLSIPDEDEQLAYRKSLGALMAHCDSELIRPIANRYPHLDPLAE